MTEPTTAAGRALRDKLLNGFVHEADDTEPLDMSDDILAIEAEAPLREVAKLRQRYVDEVLAEQTRPSDRASWAVLGFLDAFDEAMR